MVLLISTTHDFKHLECFTAIKSLSMNVLAYASTLLVSLQTVIMSFMNILT